MPKYVILDGKFLWRMEDEDDKVGKMLAFVFDPDDAQDLVGLLNSSMLLAAITLDSSGEQQSRFHVTREQLSQLAESAFVDAVNDMSGKHLGMPEGTEFRLTEPAGASDD